MKTKKELKAYLKDHEGDVMILKMYAKESGMILKTEERVILEARSKDIITGRRDKESEELVPVYLDYKTIDSVTEDFFEFTTLFGNIVRFYFDNTKQVKS